MDHSRFVGSLQRLGNLTGDGQRFIHRHWPLGDPVGEGGTFDQLQDERLRVGALLMPWMAAMFG